MSFQDSRLGSFINFSHPGSFVHSLRHQSKIDELKRQQREAVGNWEEETPGTGVGSKMEGGARSIV